MIRRAAVEQAECTWNVLEAHHNVGTAATSIKGRFQPFLSLPLVYICPLQGKGWCIFRPTQHTLHLLLTDRAHRKTSLWQLFSLLKYVCSSGLWSHVLSMTKYSLVFFFFSFFVNPTLLFFFITVLKLALYFLRVQYKSICYFMYTNCILEPCVMCFEC